MRKFHMQITFTNILSTGQVPHNNARRCSVYDVTLLQR